jgi:transcriptional regulator with XRE-family HTH domain
MTPAIIGRQIKARRLKNKLTLRKFAEQVGVAAPTASGWEAGKYKPSLPHLGKCAEVLSCKLTDLLVDKAA